MAVYVGKLLAVELANGLRLDVAPAIIGVDEEVGIVLASSRAELARGQYLERPPRSRGRRCVRLWYERRRKEYPRDPLWFHDLDDCLAYFPPGLDIRRAASHEDPQHEPPSVVLSGPDVETCPEPPGDFLCG